jgi:hypothetical protein
MYKEEFLALLRLFRESGIEDEQMNEILISYHSTAIEGSMLTEDEAHLFEAIVNMSADH